MGDIKRACVNLQALFNLRTIEIQFNQLISLFSHYTLSLYNMKNALILGFVLLFISALMTSCGGDAATSQTTIQPSPAATNTNSTAVPVGEITRDPLLGGPAEITIKATGAPQGTSYLIGILGDQRFRLDSARVSAEGVSSFDNPSGYPQGHYFMYYQNNKNFQVLLGEDQKFDITLDINNMANTIQANGSIDNELLFNNIKFENSMRPEFAEAANLLKANPEGTPGYQVAKDQQAALVQKRKDQLAKEFSQHPNSFYVAFKRAGQNPEVRLDLPQEAQVAQYRKDFWGNVNFADVRLLRTPVINNKLKRYMNELTPQHVDSIISSTNWLIDTAEPYPDYFKFFANWVPLTYEPTKTSIMDPEKILVNVIQRYFTKEKAYWTDSMSIYGFQQRANEMKNSLYGNKGPNVTSTDQFGKPQTLFDKKADYLIVYMYNPDCEHCQEQTPKLVNFYKQNKSKGIDVYAIAIDTDKQKWVDYINKTGMTFTNVHDPTNRSIYQTYYVDHTPELYVLNKDRTIIGKNLKVNQIMTVIDRDKEKG